VKRTHGIDDRTVERIAVWAFVQATVERHAPDAPAEPLPASPMLAATHLLFPIVLTPYGIAAVIAVMGARTDVTRTSVILGIVLAIMVINLVAMWFARRILIGPVIIGLQVIGAVLAVMQVALAIEFMVMGLNALGVISA